MALPSNHKWTENQLEAYSPSVGASPVAAYARSPFRGKILKLGCVLGGALTGDSTVTVAINGTTLSGASFTLTASGSAAGTIYTLVPTSTVSANQVNEDDVISFTPAGGNGASIPGNFFAVVDKAGV